MDCRTICSCRVVADLTSCSTRTSTKDQDKSLNIPFAAHDFSASSQDLEHQADLDQCRTQVSEGVQYIGRISRYSAAICEDWNFES